MIAQRNNAWDRDYLRRKLGIEKVPNVRVEPDRVVAVLREAGELEAGAFLERSRHGDPTDVETLSLQGLERDRLLAFVRRDGPGNWLSVWLRYDAGAREVDEDSILGTSVRVFKHLYPAYDLLAYFPGKQ